MKQKLLILAFMCLLLPLLCGCDAVLKVNGAVYEWTNAPDGAHSQIYFDQLPPQSNDELMPLNSVAVYFFTNEHGWDKPDINREYSKLTTAWTDSNGKFKETSICGPGEYHMKIVVDQKSYYPVEYTFFFDGGEVTEYQFTVVLVRDNP